MQMQNDELKTGLPFFIFNFAFFIFNPSSEARTMPITPKMVGTRIKRREDPRLITGQATYTDDLQLTGMLYMMCCGASTQRQDQQH